MANNRNSDCLATAPRVRTKVLLARSWLLGLALVAAAQGVPAAVACTTVAVPKSPEKLVGKSYDWDFGSGMLVVNKRHVKKSGLALSPDDHAPSWTTRYGSLTFNQYGREFPNGGINEKGLVVELMWLNESVYPPRGAAPSVNELQWIQYQLDNFATVAEVVEAAPVLAVARVYASVHYMACDASGSCATFEFIDGKMQVHSGSDLGATALTNNTYADSADYLKKFVGFGGVKPLPQGRGSLARFTRAAAAAQSYQEQSPTASVAYVFNILADIGQGDYSKWNIVYSTVSGHVSFRTLASPQIKALDAFAFDYSCTSPALLLDIDTKLASTSAASDVGGAFMPYTESANRALIKAGIDQLGADFPPGLLDVVAHYPETTQCVQ